MHVAYDCLPVCRSIRPLQTTAHVLKTWSISRRRSFPFLTDELFALSYLRTHDVVFRANRPTRPTCAAANFSITRSTLHILPSRHKLSAYIFISLSHRFSVTPRPYKSSCLTPTLLPAAPSRAPRRSVHVKVNRRQEPTNACAGVSYR